MPVCCAVRLCVVEACLSFTTNTFVRVAKLLSVSVCVIVIGNRTADHFSVRRFVADGAFACLSDQVLGGFVTVYYYYYYYYYYHRVFCQVQVR